MYILLLISWMIINIAEIFYEGIPNIISQIIFVLLILLSLMSLKKIIKLNINSSIYLFAILGVVISHVSAGILQIIFYGVIADNIERTTLSVWTGFVILISTWFLIGMRFNEAKFNGSNKLSYLVVSILLAIILFHVDESMLIPYNIITGERSDGLEVDHLVIGDWATFVLLLSLASAGGLGKLIVSIAGMIILFAIGGRTNLFIFMIISPIFIFLTAQHSSRKILVVAVMSVLASMIGMMIVSENQNTIGLSRMFLIDGLHMDESFSARWDFTSKFFNDINYYYLIGNINQIVQRHGSFGAYAHNFLSSVQYSGVVSFFLLLIVFIVTFHKAWSASLDNDFKSKFWLILTMMVFMQLCTGRFIGIPLVWFLLGYSFSQYYSQKIQK